MEQELLDALQQEGIEVAVKLVQQIGSRDLAENAFKFLKISTARTGAEALTDAILKKANLSTLRYSLYQAALEENTPLFDLLIPTVPDRTLYSMAWYAESTKQLHVIGQIIRKRPDLISQQESEAYSGRILGKALICNLLTNCNEPIHGDAPVNLIHLILSEWPELPKSNFTQKSFLVHSCITLSDFEAFQKLIAPIERYFGAGFEVDREILWSAAQSGVLQIFEYMLEKNPSLINEDTPDGKTILHEVVETDNFIDVNPIIEKILSLRPEILLNQTADGETPLYLAVKSGSYEAVKLLVDIMEPEDIALKTTDGSSAITVSLDRVPEFVDLLLQKNPKEIFYTNEHGESLLHLACSRDRWKKSSGIINYLLKREPSLVMCLARDGKTALHEARSLESVKSLIQIVPQLLKATDDEGKTPFQVILRECSEKRRLKVFEFFIELDPSGLTNTENNLLHSLLSSWRPDWTLFDKLSKQNPLLMTAKDSSGRHALNILLSNLYKQKPGDGYRIFATLLRALPKSEISLFTDRADWTNTGIVDTLCASHSNSMKYKLFVELAAQFPEVICSQTLLIAMKSEGLDIVEFILKQDPSLMKEFLGDEYINRITSSPTFGIMEFCVKYFPASYVTKVLRHNNNVKRDLTSYLIWYFSRHFYTTTPAIEPEDYPKFKLLQAVEPISVDSVIKSHILTNVQTFIHANFFRLYGVCKKCNVESEFYPIQTFDCFQNIISFLGPASLWPAGTFEAPKTNLVGTTKEERDYWNRDDVHQGQTEDPMGSLFNIFGSDEAQTPAEEFDFSGMFD